MLNVEFTQEEIEVLTSLISETIEDAVEDGQVIDSHLETAYGKLLHSEAI